MKKILIVLFAIIFVLTLPMSVAASEMPEEEGTLTEEQTTEENNNALGSDENQPESTLPESSTPERTETFSDKFISFITENYTGSALFGFAITAIIDIIYTVKKNRRLSASIGTLNNNAVAVAENSGQAINGVLVQLNSVRDTIDGYKNEMSALLQSLRNEADEKLTLEQIIKGISERLDKFMLADKELSDEIAQLLNLSNLPNSVKDELYARHIAAVKLIEGEVSTNDGNET